MMTANQRTARTRSAHGASVRQNATGAVTVRPGLHSGRPGPAVPDRSGPITGRPTRALPGMREGRVVRGDRRMLAAARPRRFGPARRTATSSPWPAPPSYGRSRGVPASASARRPARPRPRPRPPGRDSLGASGPARPPGAACRWATRDSRPPHRMPGLRVADRWRPGPEVSLRHGGMTPGRDRSVRPVRPAVRSAVRSAVTGTRPDGAGKARIFQLPHRSSSVLSRFGSTGSSAYRRNPYRRFRGLTHRFSPR